MEVDSAFGKAVRQERAAVESRSGVGCGGFGWNEDVAGIHAVSVCDAEVVKLIRSCAEQFLFVEDSGVPSVSVGASVPSVCRGVESRVGVVTEECSGRGGARSVPDVDGFSRVVGECRKQFGMWKSSVAGSRCENRCCVGSGCWSFSKSLCLSEDRAGVGDASDVGAGKYEEFVNDASTVYQNGGDNGKVKGDVFGRVEQDAGGDVGRSCLESEVRDSAVVSDGRLVCGTQSGASVRLAGSVLAVDKGEVQSDQRRFLSSGLVFGPKGGVSKGRGPNYEKNQARRVAKKQAKVGVVESVVDVESVKAVSGVSGQSVSVSDKLKRSFDERRIAENELATQRARYNIRRNDYLQKARVSEQKWETERLSSDEKLRKITEARLGASPGFAKTIVEEGLASPSAPSLSDGTVSPNSSISVEEVQKMNRTIEKQAAANVELQKKLDKFVEMFGDEGETVDDIIYPEQKKGSGMPKEETHKVMWGECVPLKGRYKFQADHYQNGNLVIAIDGEIVEVDWRGEPFEYCGRDVLYVTPSMDGHIDE